MGLHWKIGGISVKRNKTIKDQKSVTHERKRKLNTVLLPEKPMSQNRRGSVVAALVTPQHLPLPYTWNNSVDQTPPSENSYYEILALLW